MPAVAQISVNFAQLSQIVSNPSTLPTNVRLVSPRTLTQYLLTNREQPDTNYLSDPIYLNYLGGFLTAGNRVNVKHDSDLQLRQNLDVERSLFVDSIYARRKGNTSDTYQSNRTDTTRSITLAPFTTDLTTPTSRNFISITSTAGSKNISLSMNFGSQGENSIVLNNTTSDRTLNIRTSVFTINATELDILGAPVYIDETVEINKETTITDNLKVTGDLSLGTTSYNKFTITSASGNVAFTGNLTINTDRFTVASSTGNTVIAGTLNVSGNTSITGTTTLSNSITIGTGASTSSTRRIVGVRRVANHAEIVDSNYFTDPLTIGDFTERFYHTPKTITSSYTITEADGQTTILVNSSSTVNITLPAGLRVGTQVSFIRQGTGAVAFVAGAGTTLRSAPTNSFTKLAFQNSVATCFLGNSNTYYLFGDLLP